jgi:hypothetical protein
MRVPTAVVSGSDALFDELSDGEFEGAFGELLHPFPVPVSGMRLSTERTPAFHPGERLHAHAVALHIEQMARRELSAIEEQGEREAEPPASRAGEEDFSPARVVSEAEELPPIPVSLPPLPPVALPPPPRAMATPRREFGKLVLCGLAGGTVVAWLMVLSNGGSTPSATPPLLPPPICAVAPEPLTSSGSALTARPIPEGCSSSPAPGRSVPRASEAAGRSHGLKSEELPARSAPVVSKPTGALDASVKSLDQAFKAEFAEADQRAE